MTGEEPEKNGILETQVGHFKKGIVKSAKCGRQTKSTKRVFAPFVRDWWRRSMRCEEAGPKTEQMAVNRRQDVSLLRVLEEISKAGSVDRDSLGLLM